MKHSVAIVMLMSLRAAAGQCQASATVPPNDPVYGFVDRLAGAGYVDTIVVGQRPMSRREIGRILDAAWHKMPGHAADSSWMSRALDRYRRVYRDGDAPARGPTRVKLEASIAGASSPSRGIPPDGNGAIDVEVNPLLSNLLGVRRVDGATAEVGGGVELPVEPWLATAFGGRINEFRPRGSASGIVGRIDQAYVRGVFRNVAISVGRDYEFFGQGMQAGLVNSLNARGLDMVRVSSDRPFTLPSILRLMGSLQGTVLFADLGAGQAFPHTRLFNYKLSATPFAWAEVGASVGDQIGGQGAPGGTLLQKAADVFPLIDAIFLHRNLTFSNKFVGLDGRLRVPGARGLQLYAEGVLDDFDPRRFRSSITQDAGYIWGGSLDCFRECGPVRISGEYHVTGLRYYTHGYFKSGYTLDHQIIGDQLGPRGKGFYVTVDLDGIGHRLSIASAHEIRSGDKYGAASTTSNDSDFHFVLIEQHPAERRWRSVVTTAIGHPASGMTTHIAVGVERVEHFGFQPGGWRTNGLAELRMEIRPSLKRRR